MTENKGTMKSSTVGKGLVTAFATTTAFFIVLTLTLVTVMQPYANTVQAQSSEEECSIGGPSSWQEMMNDPQLKSFLAKLPEEQAENITQTYQNAYEDSLRTEEIENYIIENKEKFDVPDVFFDTENPVCTVAGSVQSLEEEKGVQFTGEELDQTILLEMFAMMGRAAETTLAN